MGVPAVHIDHTQLDTPPIVTNSILRFDPTHTTMLRRLFVVEMGKRFRALRGEIRRAIVDQDCFGMIDRGIRPLTFAVPPYRAFAFERSADKVQAFMDWLGEQEEKFILSLGGEGIGIIPRRQLGEAVEQAWTSTYIQTAYRKGIQRARQELGKAGYRVPSIAQTGGIAYAFDQPFHVDRVGLLYTRTFSGLKGVTATMDTQISQVLAQAMADGKHPHEMAKLLTATIKGPVGDLGITDTLGRFIPAERRAKMLARTEVIRAHHTATIQEYKNWAVEGVTVRAEWATAGWNVCPDCSGLQGMVFSLEEIEGMIPYHPNCRCVALPVEAGE